MTVNQLFEKPVYWCVSSSFPAEALSFHALYITFINCFEKARGKHIAGAKTLLAVVSIAQKGSDFQDVGSQISPTWNKQSRFELNQTLREKWSVPSKDLFHHHPRVLAISIDGYQLSMRSLIALCIYDFKGREATISVKHAIWQTCPALNFKRWSKSLNLQRPAENICYFTHDCCNPLLVLSLLQLKRSLNTHCRPLSLFL